MTTRLAAPLALAALLAAGCTRPLNDRPTLGGRLTTATFAEDQPAIDLASPAGLDRAAWPGHVFLVPVDATVHGPVWHGDVRLTDTTARQQGLMPTPESALELEGGTGGAQALEGLLAPLGALADIALIPVRAVAEPAWADRQSPAWLYKRSRQGGWSSATVPPPSLSGAGDAPS